jgi:hypothetical protein
MYDNLNLTNAIRNDISTWEVEANLGDEKDVFTHKIEDLIKSYLGDDHLGPIRSLSKKLDYEFFKSCLPDFVG